MIHMEGFFDKVKQGVSDTSKQAKIAVETMRLKTQISAKQKEIEGKYTEIGRLVFYSFKQGDLSSSNSVVEGICRQIAEMETEIENINKQILDMSSTKVCVCGNTVPVETKFCNQCGHQFETLVGAPIASAAESLQEKQCTCGNIESAEARFCTSCGKAI